MFLKDVIINIKIEEQNRNRDNVEKTKELSSKANVVEKNPKPKNSRSRKQNSRTKPNASNKVQNSTIKKRGNCFVCGKFDTMQFNVAIGRELRSPIQRQIWQKQG